MSPHVIVILCIMLYKYHVHVIVYANKDDDYYMLYYIYCVRLSKMGKIVNKRR